MTKLEAIKIATETNEDDVTCALADQLFAALYERTPDDKDRQEGVWSHVCAALSEYDYATDAITGTVMADSVESAYAICREKITDEMIEDGATLWVESKDGGDRITLTSKKYATLVR